MPNALLTDRLEVRARQIVADLGGTWSRSRGMCRCPAHEDRTPSLSVTLGSRAILFHCFAGCPNDAVLAALAQRGVKASSLFDGRAEPIRTALPEAVPSASIQRLWREATCHADSPAERYLAGRGISAGSPDLRYHPRTPLGPKGAVRFLPALLAAVRTDLGIIALHRTFLECKTFTVARFNGPKRALGALGRGAVRLHGPRGGKLGLAEGIETALSARELFGIPCWATLGTERYGRLARTVRQRPHPPAEIAVRQHSRARSPPADYKRLCLVLACVRLCGGAPHPGPAEDCRRRRKPQRRDRLQAARAMRARPRSGAPTPANLPYIES